MSEVINLDLLPLSILSHKACNLLSCLLNSNKLFPTDGPEKLPRDWRGLASLVNISSEVLFDFKSNQDKFVKIIEIWQSKNDGTATIGKLIEYLQRLDRFDVYDDLLELIEKGELLDLKPKQYVQNNQLSPLEDIRDDFITQDDVRCGEPQVYHAYVVSAKEDQDFVDELLSRMKGYGFKLCTEDDLLPGNTTRYVAVSRLMSERCHKIIIVYSPSLWTSPAVTFFMDYAQAVGIEMKKPKLVPLMYRPCQLPGHLSYYHTLVYPAPGQKSIFDFWESLARALEVANLPREINGVKIESPITAKPALTNGISKNTSLLALPEQRWSSNSTSSLNNLKSISDDSHSISNISQVSDTKTKKVGKISKLLKSLKGKKYRKEEVVINL